MNMMSVLEITAGDAGLWAGAIVLVIGAMSAMAVAIINAIKGGNQVVSQKLDAAATRREQIGTAIIDPAASQLPPKEQP